jgi:hypothetical protein
MPGAPGAAGPFSLTKEVYHWHGRLDWPQGSPLAAVADSDGATDCLQYLS